MLFINLKHDSDCLLFAVAKVAKNLQRTYTCTSADDDDDLNNPLLFKKLIGEFTSPSFIKANMVKTKVSDAI